MDRPDLAELLIRHEGLRLKPYRCTEGKLSIGVGRNLEGAGISKGEALTLLSNDIVRVELEARRAFPWFEALAEPRKDVVLSLLFNMGLRGVSEFPRMLDALARGDYSQAATEMLDSHWADQVGDRATELSRIMATGHR